MCSYKSEECYQALNREYALAEYFLTVRGTKQRQIMSRYRLSAHSLAFEKGRQRNNWLSREERLSVPCAAGYVETDTHFLLYCKAYKNQWQIFTANLKTLIWNINKISAVPGLKHTKHLSLLDTYSGYGLHQLYFLCMCFRSSPWDTMHCSSVLCCHKIGLI